MHTENAPTLPAGFYDYIQEEKIPVLGVCYGMQLLVYVRTKTLQSHQQYICKEKGGHAIGRPSDIWCQCSAVTWRDGITKGC